MDAEATGVCRVRTALYDAASFQPPQHPGNGRGLDAEADGELPAAQSIVLPKLDEQHLLADVQSVFGQERADMTAVGLADLRQYKARVLSYLLHPDRCSSISVNRLMPPSAPSTYRSFS